MEKFNLLLEHKELALLTIVGVIEIVVRLKPTKKDYSFISNVIKVVDFLIPNRKK